jgi:hypothetical protein
LPAVQLDLHYCFRARLCCWGLFLVTVLALGGLGLPLLAACCLALLQLALFRWRLPSGTLRFDGRHWWLSAPGRVAEKLLLHGRGYTGDACLAGVFCGESRDCSLFLWRFQVDRESWRRLQLALRYGVSTVSTAPGARPG